MQVGPEAWVLVPETAPGVAVAAARALWKLFALAQLRIVRPVTPSAAAVATWVIPAPSISAASAPPLAAQAPSLGGAGRRQFPGLRGPVQVDDAALGDRPPDLNGCRPKPLAPFATVEKALLQRRLDRLGGRPVAHRVQGSELKRNRRSDLEVQPESYTHAASPGPEAIVCVAAQVVDARLLSRLR